MKEELIITTKGMSEGLSTQEVLDVFNNAKSLDEIKSAVERAKDRLYVTFATVEVRDKQGEVIPVDDVLAKQEILMERNAPITDMHTNRHVGRTLAWKVMSNPEGSENKGILHLNKIFNHYDFDTKIWSEIVSGERSGSSVGGLSSGRHFAFHDGLPTQVLDGFDWFENATVFSPANQLALNQAVSHVAKGGGMKAEVVLKHEDGVYKIVQKDDGICLEKLGIITKEVSSMKLDENFINQNSNKEEIKGDIMEEPKKGDIVDVAMQKMAARETLTKDEHDAAQGRLAELFKACDPEKEKDEKKAAEEKPEVKPKDEEEDEEMKGLKAEVASLKKSFEDFKAASVVKAEVPVDVAKSDVVVKVDTPRPDGQESTPPPAVSVQKFNALDIAMGKTKATWPSRAELGQ